MNDLKIHPACILKRADDKDEADIRYIVPLTVGGVLGLLAIVIVRVLFN